MLLVYNSHQVQLLACPWSVAPFDEPQNFRWQLLTEIPSVPGLTLLPPRQVIGSTCTRGIRGFRVPAEPSNMIFLSLPLSLVILQPSWSAPPSPLILGFIWSTLLSPGLCCGFWPLSLGSAQTAAHRPNLTVNDFALHPISQPGKTTAPKWHSTLHDEEGIQFASHFNSLLGTVPKP